MASSTSRIEVFRGRPPGYTGMRGWTRAHCSSVRSLGYRWVRIPHRTRQTTPYRTDSQSESELDKKRDDFMTGFWSGYCLQGYDRPRKTNTPATTNQKAM